MFDNEIQVQEKQLITPRIPKRRPLAGDHVALGSEAAKLGSFSLGWTNHLPRWKIET
jgi:hypothetical protein